ncbi:MAG: rod shape-determining protein RodA [Nocardioides sp.]
MRSPAQARQRGTSSSVGTLDWWLLIAVIGLLAFGAVLVWSAARGQGVGAISGGLSGTGYLPRHVINVVLGLVLLAAVVRTEQRWIRIGVPLGYWLTVLLLATALILGSSVNGSRAWIELAGWSVQPSEFAKLAVVSGAGLWIRERGSARWRSVTVRDLGGLLALAAIPGALVMMQPDLGTLVVLLVTMVGVLVAAGVPGRWLAILAGTAGSLVACAIAVGWLADYQMNRFLAFANPDLDPRGAGYNTEQARIAVGNGGLFGKGLFEGSQTRAGFVPEQRTDFIFTVAGEELGLVGAGLIVILLGVVVWRALVIAAAAGDAFGRITAAGIACWFGFQSFQNIGMCLGIMPVSGVPLPFVSYGGSSMFACLLAVGLLLSIDRSSTRVDPAVIWPDWRRVAV